MKTDWSALTQSESQDTSPGLTLWRLTNQWQREIRAALAPLGLTHVQFVLIACLAWCEDHEGGLITQRQLAENACTDPMMTSQVVRELVARGLMIRQRHPKDARAFVLSLTDEARKLVVVAMPAVEAVDAQFFAQNKQSLAKLSQ